MQELRSEARNPFTKFLRRPIRKIAERAKRRSFVSRIAARRGQSRRAFTQGPSPKGQGEIAELRAKALLALQAKKQIRVAAITTPGKALAVRAISGLLGPGRGSQLGAVLRQQAARVPLGAKVAVSALGLTAATEALTGETPIGLARQAFLRAGEGVQNQRRRPQMAGDRGLAVGRQLPPSHVIVKTWQTFAGGPIFARLADGHIAVQKKDGTIKHFRPYRPVVIPRKWNARSMSRVATALKRQRKTATKIMQITGGMPKGRK